MDFVDYRKKLGIGFSDEQKFKLFKTKAFNILSVIGNGYSGSIEYDEYFEFCMETGSQINPRHTDSYAGHDRFADCVKILSSHISTMPEFLSYLVWFANSIHTKKTCGSDWNRKKYVNFISLALNECHIAFDLLEDDGKYFIFPKGAKELDDALVSEPLEWLKKYPKSHKEWIEALKLYADLSDGNPSEVADKFRKALERFFQEFFESEKSLENMKSEYGDFLTSKGVPAEIKNNLEKLLDLYAKYMNNYAKHHDKAGQNVLEYILYQTGNLIRLLITLKQEEK